MKTIDSSFLPQNGNPLSRRLLLGAGLAAAGGLILGQPANAAASHGSRFDRGKAVEWAKKHVDSEYVFDNDCTYFVSRALWAGGMAKTGDWNSSTVNPWLMADKRKHAFGPTKAAASADFLKNYLKDSNRGVLRQLDFGKNNVPDAELGDVIFYDWDNGADGFADHAMMITSFSKDSNGTYRYPQVSGHSQSVRDQGWTWSGYKRGWIEQKYKGSKDKARAYLLHVTY